VYGTVRTVVWEDGGGQPPPPTRSQKTQDIALAGLAFPGEILAFMLVSPLAGWAADRWDQRHQMLISDGLRGLLLGLMLLLVHVDVAIGPLLAVSLLIGAAGAFFHPARSAFLRRLMSGKDFGEAVTLEGTTIFLTRMIAPAAMGALLAVVPVSVGIAADMASFWISGLLILTLYRLTLPAPDVAATEAETPVGHDWRDGWRALWQSPALRWILPLDAVLCVTGMCSFGMIMAYLQQVAHVGAHHAGWLMAVAGACGAVGTQLAGRLGQSRRSYLMAASSFAVAYCLVGWGVSLGAILFAWVVRGLGMGLISVMISRRFAAEIPVAVMGRAQAAYDQVCCLGAVLGGVSAPLLLRHVGPATAYRGLGLVVGGFLVMAALAAAWSPEPEPATS
jgi:DHA3 family macrolide efflux protein-like MFS transporter